MKERQEPNMANVVRTLRQEIARTPYGEVGVVLTVHAGDVRRIDYKRTVRVLRNAMSDRDPTRQVHGHDGTVVAG